MSAPVFRQNQREATGPPRPAPPGAGEGTVRSHRGAAALLRTSVQVGSDEPHLHAVVALHGELCPVSAPQLRSELEQLVDDGVVDITVDLQHLSLCTSQGLDVFDDVHALLQQRHGGTLHLRLDGASPLVERVVHLVDDNDATFSPSITEVPGTSTAPAPHGRPGGRTT